MCGDEWSWILLDIVIVVSALTEMSLALVSSLVNEGPAVWLTPFTNKFLQKQCVDECFFDLVK